ncbi:hypothetical protein F383_06790 [Gossypium arboreum]|uniref:Uncharacterized protein n=1 Tax=Gossypium arboreum TaxID=29729 RepID=A0A0B0PN91_GOSAR|nr:hypothetical protein F383_06790 [Gossypium arboreum]
MRPIICTHSSLHLVLHMRPIIWYR